MPHPAPPTSPAEAVGKLIRTSGVVTIATSLIAMACLIGGASLGYRTATEEVAEKVSVTVEAEGTHRERRGGRRSRHWADVRHVDVSVEDGTSGQVNSDTLRIGDTAELWRDLEDGSLSTDEPGGFGLGLILLLGGLGLSGLAFAATAVGSARRTARLRGVQVETSPPFQLELDRTKLAAQPHLVRGPIPTVPLRVSASLTPQLAVGSEQGLILTPQHPIDLSQGIPERWEGRLLYKGLLMSVVALRTSPHQPWWVTDL